MKTILAASFGALMLAGTIGAAQAAPQANSAPSAPVTVSTPQYAGQMQGPPVFNYHYTAPTLSSADPVSTKGPLAHRADPIPVGDPVGSGGAQAAPVFHSRTAVTVTPNNTELAPVTGFVAPNGPVSLVNQRGGGGHGGNR